jgi:hypothetical protein
MNAKQLDLLSIPALFAILKSVETRMAVLSRSAVGTKSDWVPNLNLTHDEALAEFSECVTLHQLLVPRLDRAMAEAASSVKLVFTPNGTGRNFGLDVQANLGHGMETLYRTGLYLSEKAAVDCVEQEGPDNIAKTVIRYLSEKATVQLEDRDSSLVRIAVATQFRQLAASVSKQDAKV